jgi:enterochelin esterase-like enzyme
VAAGAGAAALGVDPERALRRITRDCGPEPPLPPASGIPVVRRTLRSRAVGGPVGYAVAVPPGAGAARPLPVCLCLPGRGGTGAGTLASLRVPDALAEVVAARGVRPFALVGVDGGESYWHPRAGGEDRLAMLLDELLPALAGDLGLGPPRAVMGWYGAVLAETRPRAFRAVVASSPAVWVSREDQADAVPDAFDGDEDFRAHDVIAGAGRLRGLAVRIDCGSEDPFAEAARVLAAACPTRPVGGIEVGCHDDATWRRVLPDQLAFVGRALA